MNKVLLSGLIGKDPEVKVVGTDKKVSQFSVATNEGYYDKDKKWKEKTVWHNIVFWKDASRFSKGDAVNIEGKISNRTYEKDGVTKYISEVVASSVNWCPKGKEKDVSKLDPAAQSLGGDTNSGDELPF